MNNKYPGKCYICSQPVGPRDGQAEKHGKGWRIRHNDCKRMLTHQLLSRRNIYRCAHFPPADILFDVSRIPDQCAIDYHPVEFGPIRCFRDKEWQETIGLVTSICSCGTLYYWVSDNWELVSSNSRFRLMLYAARQIRADLPKGKWFDRSRCKR